jgi:hypothetical protein
VSGQPRRHRRCPIRAHRHRGGRGLYLQDRLAPIRVVPKRLCSLHAVVQFNSNFHREDAKNAKKAVGELVDFLIPSRSSISITSYLTGKATSQPTSISRQRSSRARHV